MSEDAPKTWQSMGFDVLSHPKNYSLNTRAVMSSSMVVRAYSGTYEDSTPAARYTFSFERDTTAKDGTSKSIEMIENLDPSFLGDSAAWRSDNEADNDGDEEL